MEVQSGSKLTIIIKLWNIYLVNKTISYDIHNPVEYFIITKMKKLRLRINKHVKINQWMTVAIS